MVSVFLVTCMFSGYMSVSCPGETGEPSSTVTDDLIGLAAETGNKAASAAANAGETAAITQAANSKEADLLLHYDDRYIFEEEIDYIETVSLDSFAVGTESPDESVLVQDSSGSGKVTARGCGRAEVHLKNGKNYTVRVEPSAISLVLFAGQSNGEGRPMDISRLEEYKRQWVICEEGQVYSSYAPSDEYGQDMYHEVAWYEDTEGIGALSEENAGRFIPYS